MPDVWALLESAPRPTPAAGAGELAKSAPGSLSDRRIPSFRILDLLGAILWLYFVIKIFVGDVERLALGAFGPNVASLADYRLIFYLLIFAAIVWFGRRRWWRVLYVLLFPVVVTMWKLPYLLYRHRSWALFLAILQTMASVSTDLRYRLTTLALVTASFIIILFVAWAPLLALAAICLSWFVIWSFGRFFWHTLRAPSFTSIQRLWIERLMKNDQLSSTWSLSEELRDPSLEQYTDAQVQQVAMRISTGIFVNKVLYLWAWQLDRYRRRLSPALTFGAISFASLFIGAMLGTAFIGLAIYKISPTEYRVDHEPTILAFLVHSVASLTGSEAGGITASGQGALLLQLAGAVIGLVVLVSLVLNVAFTFRRERDDKATSELVQELKARAREQEASFVQEYSVGIDEAKRRLEQLGAGFAVLVTYVTRSIPEDFFDPSGDVRQVS